MRYQFRTAEDSDTNKTLIGPKQNNHEFDWWPVIRVTYLKGHYPGFKEKYLVQLFCVAPSQMPDEKWPEIADDYDNSDAKPAEIDKQILMLVEAGWAVNIRNDQGEERTGNNMLAMIGDCRKELPTLFMLTGFYWDKPINGIGATGWHIIRGVIIPEPNDRE